jgi:hypothetical protein
MLPPSWKTEIEETVEKTANAAREGQKADNDKNASEISTAIKAFSDAYQAQHNKPEEPDKVKRALDIATVALLFFTALFTGLAWWIFRYQLHEMQSSSLQIERSITASNRIADEAKNANALTGEAGRAWIGAISALVVPPITEMKNSKINVNFSNAGKSPAYIIRIKCGAAILDAPPVDPPYALTSIQAAMGSKSIMVPGQQFGCPLNKPPISGQEAGKIRLSSGAYSFYVYGEVVYRDVAAETERVTHVCWFYNASVDAYVFCSTYNSAK